MDRDEQTTPQSTQPASSRETKRKRMVCLSLWQSSGIPRTRQSNRRHSAPFFLGQWTTRERETDRATEREGHSASLSVCFWSFSTTATAATAAAASHRTVSSYSSTPPFLTCIMARYVYMYICVCVDVWLTGSESVSACLCVCESVSLAVALAVVVPCRAAVVLVFRVVHGVFRKNRGRSTKTPKSRSNDHMRVLHTPISDKEISSIHSTKSKSHSTALHCIGPHCIRLD